jgi:peptidoglycan/LPS O-acetylase OafA/YrhL
MPIVKQTILPLTSVRFFAALYVVVFHTLTELIRGVDDPNAIHGGLLGLGYISVSFFFVLSGFILALVYLNNEREPEMGKFWSARFARVYPLFLFTLLLDTPHSFLAAVHHLGFHAAVISIAKALLANIFLVQAWLVSFRGIDNPNWSLSVEAFFYLMFPLLSIPLIRRRSGTLIFILVTSYVLGVALVAGISGFHFRQDSVKFSPILHLHEFVEGMCTGLLTMRMTNQLKETLERISVYLIGCAAIVFIIFVILSPRLLSLHLLIHDGLLSPLFILVIISLTYGDSIVHRILSHPWLVVLGEASYGLYLIHIPLWHFAKPLPLGHSMTTYPLFLITAIGCSVLSFYFLERPSRRFILSKLQTRPKENLVSSSLMQ